MDPYLEHPALWPDVHNSLLAALRDELAQVVAPHYYVALEQRAYLLTPDDIVLVGRPDISMVGAPLRREVSPAPHQAGVMEVELPMTDELRENFLEIREIKTGRAITVLELLSPTNKINLDGREQYLRKRGQILRSRTNLVEIDLLRAGGPMPMTGVSRQSDYRILVSREWRRPRADLLAFDVRGVIPTFALPLQMGDTEPSVDLNTALQDLYRRARFDLRLDYTLPAVPPLTPGDADWAASLMGRR
jgi:hypothetical protein